MWESFISFGLALIDKWLVIVAGIVLPVLIGVVNPPILVPPNIRVFRFMFQSIFDRC